MSNASIQIGTASFFGTRFSARALIGLTLAIATLAPLAIVAYGLSRGGVESYMVLAALLLG